MKNLMVEVCFLAPVVLLHLFLANFFTAILHHGYVPSALQDAILLPIPKGHKDPLDSSNLPCIALASCVSKVLEWCIILTWSQYFITDDLQFGFKLPPCALEF